MTAGGVDVTATLRAERHALLDLLGGLAPVRWDALTECPAWTVHGVAQHVLGDDLSLLARQRDEFLVPAMASIAEALAANLPTFDSPEGTSLALAVDGLGSWHLRRQGEGWELDADRSEADVTVRIAHDRATTVISRGLAREEVPAELTVEGDADLGAAIAGVVSHLSGRPTPED